MKKIILGAMIFGLVLGLGPAAPVNATDGYCGISWGSLAKSADPTGPSGLLMNIRTGRHMCFDRMVFDIPAGSGLGYDARYVSAIYADGSGDYIPVTGGAKLRIVVNTPSYNPETGEPTYNAVTGQKLPGVNLTGYETFRDAKFAGSFEGQTTVGLGVRATLPFRVFEIEDRLVVDVAHRWH